MLSSARNCLTFPWTFIVTFLMIQGSDSLSQKERQGNNFESNSLFTPQQPQLRPAGTKLSGNFGLEPNGRKVIQDDGEQLQNLDQQSEYETPNYDFKYHIHGGGNFFGHEESRKDYKAQGQYHVLLPDGRRQVVTYYADETGFHPTITYERVGVPNSHDAATPTGYDKYQPKQAKRSRFYRHSKRVHLNYPLKFKTI